MKKLNAFTLLELMVSMLLSGIVVALILTFYVQFTGYRSTLDHHVDSDREALTFYSTLKHDVDRAELIYPEDKRTLRFIFGNNQLTWLFEDERFILRQEAERTDTFTLHWNDLDYKTFSENTNLVTSFSLDLKMDDKLYFPVKVHKRYATGILLKYENKPYGD